MELFNVAAVSLSDVKSYKTQFNRKINQDHVRLLLESYTREKNKNGQITPIGMMIAARMGEDTYLLDGQHRREVFMMLNEPSQVLVQTFEVFTEQEMMELYLRVKSNRPADPILMVPVKIEANETVDALLSYIKTTYGPYLSKEGVKPHFPNITLDYMSRAFPKIVDSDKWTVDNIENKFEEFNQQCKRELEMSRNKIDRDRLGKALRANTPKPLYINRAILDLLNEK